MFAYELRLWALVVEGPVSVLGFITNDMARGSYLTLLHLSVLICYLGSQQQPSPVAVVRLNE